MLTRDQRYANRAFERIQSVTTGNKKEYKAAAQELPATVRSAGLVQALIFMKSRGGAHERILEDVALTLGYNDKDALIAASRNAHLSQYIRLTEQVIDALQWYKRLVQAEFK
jgi:CRISPR-associated protein Cmr5